MATAQEASGRAKPGSAVIGWKLNRGDRRELLRRFPPKFKQTIADHVTLEAKVARGSELPEEREGTIVGRADDGSGVEAMVVQIGGTTDRPDGSTYHITWSLGPGRKAVESNDVIAHHGWTPIDPPVSIRLDPQRFL